MLTELGLGPIMNSQGQVFIERSSCETPRNRPLRLSRCRRLRPRGLPWVRRFASLPLQGLTVISAERVHCPMRQKSGKSKHTRKAQEQVLMVWAEPVKV